MINIDNIKEIYSINHLNEIILEVFITDQCNLNCKYCINLIRGYRRKNINIDLFQLYKFIDFLKKSTQKKIVLIFLGGEPTLHPDLVDFCEKIKNDNYIKLIIYTNFQKPIDFYLQFIHFKNISFKISFHYTDNKHLKDFLEKIQKLYTHINLINEIIVMLTNDFDYCVNAFKAIKDIFNNTKCSLLVKNDLYNPQYTNEQFEIYSTINNMNCKNSNIIIKYKNNTSNINSNFFDIINNISFYKWLCNAGKEQLFIDLYGNILLCKNSLKPISIIFNFKTIKLNSIICLYTGICTNEISYRKKLFK